MWLVLAATADSVVAVRREDGHAPVFASTFDYIDHASVCDDPDCGCSHHAVIDGVHTDDFEDIWAREDELYWDVLDARAA